MLKTYNKLLMTNIRLEHSMCVVSSWVIKMIYIILIWNTINGSFNLNNCFYHCLIFTLILHLKVLFNSPPPPLPPPSSLLLLLFIIYIVNILVVRSRFCRVIYYFDTPALEIIHQSFGRINYYFSYMLISQRLITLLSLNAWFSCV